MDDDPCQWRDDDARKVKSMAADKPDTPRGRFVEAMKKIVSRSMYPGADCHRAACEAFADAECGSPDGVLCARKPDMEHESCRAALVKEVMG